MATLMDIIMQEYRKMPSVSSFFPPRAEGDTGLSTPIIQTPNRRPQIPQEVYENFQRVVDPTMRAVPTVAPMRPSPFDETNIAAPRFSPERISPFDETNMAAPNFAPAALSQGATNAPLPPRIPGGQTRGVREPGFFERLFQGTDFQSNNMPVTMALPSTDATPPQYINFGDAANAADFFRADRALMQQNPAMFGLLGGSNG
jgi:hypothetical protein